MWNTIIIRLDCTAVCWKHAIKAAVMQRVSRTDRVESAPEAFFFAIREEVAGARRGDYVGDGSTCLENWLENARLVYVDFIRSIMFSFTSGHRSVPRLLFYVWKKRRTCKNSRLKRLLYQTRVLYSQLGTSKNFSWGDLASWDQETQKQDT